MASAIFFLDLKGKASHSIPLNPRACKSTNNLIKTLLARNYRGDIPMSAVEKFPVLLSEAEEESSAVPPCFSDEGINVPLPLRSLPTHSLCHIKSDDGLTVPLHSTQQPLPARSHETQHQRHRDPPLPAQDRRGLHRVLQGAGGGEHPRQFRDHLRAAGRDDGFRVSADDGE